MKLKFGFPGLLWPFGKQYLKVKSSLNLRNNEQRFFDLALLGLWLLVFLFSTYHAKAKAQLRVGAQLPDAAIHQVINYPSADVKISDFKGKLLILDFWDIWCGACIDAMPEVARLRNEYSDQVQFISVNTNKLQVIQKFLAQRTDIAALHLTMSLHDTVLTKIFVHQLVPHVVWISPDGRYLGASTQVDLNKETIDQILKTGNAHFKDPKNDLLTVDYDKPLFADGNGSIPDYLYKSVITKYQPGLASQSGIQSGPLQHRIYVTNDDLYNLYLTALAIPHDVIPENRIIYARPAFEKVFRTGTLDRNKNYLFCYQRMCPATSHQDLKTLMRNDLNACFQLKVTLEKRWVNCMVIKDLNINLPAQSGDPKTNVSEHADSSNLMTLSAAGLAERLNLIVGMPPTIVETKSRNLIAVPWSDQLKNSGALNKWLIPKGLIAHEEPREILVMLVAEKSPSALLVTP